jgi:hypothetical protein
MKPDKHKKRDYFRGSRSDYDDTIRKDPKIHQIKDEDQLDELPSKGKTNLVYRGKYFSNAFDRFLRMNLGKKWDDVYSEIIKKVGHEESIKWKVELHTFEQEGKIYYNGFCGTQEVSGFYVHNGILCVRRRGKYISQRIRNPKTRVTFNEGFVVFKDKGLFFKAPTDKTYGWDITIGRTYSKFEKGDSYLKYHIVENGESSKQVIDAKHIRSLNEKELKNWELPDTEIND